MVDDDIVADRKNLWFSDSERGNIAGLGTPGWRKRAVIRAGLRRVTLGFTKEGLL